MHLCSTKWFLRFFSLWKRVINNLFTVWVFHHSKSTRASYSLSFIIHPKIIINFSHAFKNLSRIRNTTSMFLGFRSLVYPLISQHRFLLSTKELLEVNLFFTFSLHCWDGHICSSLESSCHGNVAHNRRAWCPKSPFTILPLHYLGSLRFHKHHLRPGRASNSYEGSVF